MCLRPKSWWTKEGERITIACQECRQCLDLKSHDWVGRNIAESKTSLKAHAVTLTYGRDEHGNEDHPRAKVLTYSDAQKWFKLMRYHGYPCRYFLSGEYGPAKGRVHWHFIVYWLDRVPAWSGFDQHGRWSDNQISRGSQKIRFNHQRLGDDGKPALVRGQPAFWWPHGWTQVSEGASPEAISYVCKYIRKDVNAVGKQSQFMMSKQPPLGAVYFQQRAERYVAAQLAPQGGMGYQEGRLMHGMGGYKYSWPDVTKMTKEGKREILDFQLRGVSLDMFLAHYVAAWQTVWGDRPMPSSKLLDGFVDAGAWKEVTALEKPLTLRPDPQHEQRVAEGRERCLAAIRNGHMRRSDRDGDVDRFKAEFEALRPEIEAVAQRILIEKWELKNRKEK